MTKEKLNALLFCMGQRAVQERKYGEFLKVCAELENRIKAKSKNKIKCFYLFCPFVPKGKFW